MKKGLVFAALALLVSVAPVSNALASTYGGTTVAVESDGKTYNVTAQSGDTLTLSDLGSGNGKLAMTFGANVSGSVVVEESAGRPAGASVNAPGTVSKYFNVTLNGFSNSSVSSAKWTYSVPKSFLDQNGAASSNVFLHHFGGGTWERLTTREVAATSDSVTFESDVKSFSPFAITAVEGLSNTGSPYMLGAILSGSILTVLGASFALSRRKQQA